MGTIRVSFIATIAMLATLLTVPVWAQEGGSSAQTEATSNPGNEAAPTSTPQAEQSVTEAVTSQKPAMAPAKPVEAPPPQNVPGAVPAGDPNVVPVIRGKKKTTAPAYEPIAAPEGLVSIAVFEPVTQSTTGVEQWLGDVAQSVAQGVASADEGLFVVSGLDLSRSLGGLSAPLKECKNVKCVGSIAKKIKAERAVILRLSRDTTECMLKGSLYVMKTGKQAASASRKSACTIDAIEKDGGDLGAELVRLAAEAGNPKAATAATETTATAAGVAPGAAAVAVGAAAASAESGADASASGGDKGKSEEDKKDGAEAKEEEGKKEEEEAEKKDDEKDDKSKRKSASGAPLSAENGAQRILWIDPDLQRLMSPSYSGHLVGFYAGVAPAFGFRGAFKEKSTQNSLFLGLSVATLVEANLSVAMDYDFDQVKSQAQQTTDATGAAKSVERLAAQNGFMLQLGHQTNLGPLGLFGAVRNHYDPSGDGGNGLYTLDFLLGPKVDVWRFSAGVGAGAEQLMNGGGLWARANASLDASLLFFSLTADMRNSEPDKDLARPSKPFEGRFDILLTTPAPVNPSIGYSIGATDATNFAGAATSGGSKFLPDFNQSGIEHAGYLGVQLSPIDWFVADVGYKLGFEKDGGDKVFRHTIAADLLVQF